jgi:hypothetical protein
VRDCLHRAHLDVRLQRVACGASSIQAAEIVRASSEHLESTRARASKRATERGKVRGGMVRANSKHLDIQPFIPQGCRGTSAESRRLDSKGDMSCHGMTTANATAMLRQAGSALFVMAAQFPSLPGEMSHWQIMALPACLPACLPPCLPRAGAQAQAHSAQSEESTVPQSHLACWRTKHCSSRCCRDESGRPRALAESRAHPFVLQSAVWVSSRCWQALCACQTSCRSHSVQREIRDTGRVAGEAETEAVVIVRGIVAC